MLDRIKEAAKKNPRMAILLVLAALAAVIAGFALFGMVEENWPSRARIEAGIVALGTKQKELQKELNSHNILKRNRDSYIESSHLFWIIPRDGDAETNAQKIIEEAAKAADLSLNTIGRVQVNKISEGLAYNDISLQASASIEQISKFVDEIARRKPRFYWSSISMAPDNIRNPQKVVVSGSVRFVSVTDDDIVKKLLGNKLGEKK